MCHLIVNAKGAKLITGNSSTTADYRTPTSGKVKIVPCVTHEQVVPGKKADRKCYLQRYEERRYIIPELM